jgi:hypothetical protein
MSGGSLALSRLCVQLTRQSFQPHTIPSSSCPPLEPNSHTHACILFCSLQDTSRSWAWYFIRIITQVVALGTALAGVVMVLAAFGNRNPGHGLWVWHQALGLLAMGG